VENLEGREEKRITGNPNVVGFRQLPKNSVTCLLPQCGVKISYEGGCCKENNCK